MLIYYFINCALLPSWEQKSPFFARGLKLCKTLDLVEFVDDLAQVDARFHVVVVIGEDLTHEQGAFVAAGKVGIGEGGEEPLLDEFDELISGDTFVVARPLIPVQLGGYGLAVVVLQQLQLFIFIAEYFQKQHPPQLQDTQFITASASILAHDVAGGFDDGGDGGHASSSGVSLIACNNF